MTAPTLTRAVAADCREVPADDLLTIEQAAARMNMSVRYVRRLVTERRVAFHRMGRSVRFKAPDLDAFIDAQRVEPMTAESIWATLRTVA